MRAESPGAAIARGEEKIPHETFPEILRLIGTHNFPKPDSTISATDFRHCQPVWLTRALGRMAPGRMALGRVALGRLALGRMALGRLALGRVG